MAINKTAMVGIVSSIIALIIYFNNDYMTFKERDCVVLDKLTTTGGRKHSGRFYLVLKDDRGIVFDEAVSPATFSQAEIGERLRFDLRQMDIRQTFRQNLIYFFGQIIFAVIGIVFLCAGFCFKN